MKCIENKYIYTYRIYGKLIDIGICFAQPCNKIEGSSNDFEALVFKFFVVSNCLIIIGKYISVY